MYKFYISYMGSYQTQFSYCFLKTRKRVDLTNCRWNQFSNFRSQKRQTCYHGNTMDGWNGEIRCITQVIMRLSSGLKYFIHFRKYISGHFIHLNYKCLNVSRVYKNRIVFFWELFKIRILIIVFGMETAFVESVYFIV